MEGWKNKLLSLIKGPGWRPGSPWTGNLEEVPDVRRLYWCMWIWNVQYVQYHVDYIKMSCIVMLITDQIPGTLFISSFPHHLERLHINSFCHRIIYLRSCQYFQRREYYFCLYWRLYWTKIGLITYFYSNVFIRDWVPWLSLLTYCSSYSV